PDAPQRSDEGLGHGRLRRRGLVRGVVADHHGGSTSMVGFLRKWGARMKPATKPPMCAQKAGPPAGMATRARAPCASWMRNQKRRKMSAGTSARCKKKREGTSARMRAPGNSRKYAPKTPAIAPLAPIIGTREKGLTIIWATAAAAPQMR